MRVSRHAFTCERTVHLGYHIYFFSPARRSRSRCNRAERYCIMPMYRQATRATAAHRRDLFFDAPQDVRRFSTGSIHADVDIIRGRRVFAVSEECCSPRIPRCEDRETRCENGSRFLRSISRIKFSSVVWSTRMKNDAFRRSAILHSRRMHRVDAYATALCVPKFE